MLFRAFPHSCGVINSLGDKYNKILNHLDFMKDIFIREIHSKI